MKKLFIGLLAAAGLVACSSSKEVVTLNGAGATFPASIYNAWFQELAKDSKYKVNYQAVGSGVGAVKLKSHARREQGSRCLIFPLIALI